MESTRNAFRTGLFVDGNNIFRADFPIDYRALHDWVDRHRSLLRSTAYIVVDPENPEKSRPFVHFLMNTGFKVVQRPLVRTPDGQVRSNTSVALAVDMVLQAENLDIAVLVSGDGNLVPAVEQLQRRGRRVELIAFTDRLSKDLLDTVDSFLPLQRIDNIQRDSSPRDDRGYYGGPDHDDDGSVKGENDGGDEENEGDGEGDDKSPEEL